VTQTNLTVRTTMRDEVVDLTPRLRALVAESGVRDGVLLVCCPHTTAGVVINEGYDPDVARDVLDVLDRLVPWHGAYAHAEGNTAAHVKAILTGASQTLPIRGGELEIGTWQAVQFYEFDGPRTRTVVVVLQESAP
jgi:secondary thiamine-phosphate synthase enzyme